jgi:hypothetical protein
MSALLKKELMAKYKLGPTCQFEIIATIVKNELRRASEFNA